MTPALKKQINIPMSKHKLTLSGFNPDRQFIILKNKNGEKGTIWYSQLSKNFLDVINNHLIVDDIGTQKSTLDLPVEFTGEIEPEDGYLKFNGKVKLL